MDIKDNMQQDYQYIESCDFKQLFFMIPGIIMHDIPLYFGESESSKDEYILKVSTILDSSTIIIANSIFGGKLQAREIRNVEEDVDAFMIDYRKQYFEDSKALFYVSTGMFFENVRQRMSAISQYGVF